MQHPIFALVLFFVLWLFLLAYDFLFGVNFSAQIDLMQDLAFSGFGLLFGLIFAGLRNGNKKPDLIDTHKLAQEIADDEKKQLQDKIKTLEYAIDRLSK